MHGDLISYPQCPEEKVRHEDKARNLSSRKADRRISGSLATKSSPMLASSRVSKKSCLKKKGRGGGRMENECIEAMEECSQG